MIKIKELLIRLLKSLQIPYKTSSTTSLSIKDLFIPHSSLFFLQCNRYVTSYIASMLQKIFVRSRRHKDILRSVWSFCYFVVLVLQQKQITIRRRSYLLFSSSYMVGWISLKFYLFISQLLKELVGNSHISYTFPT